MGLWFRGVSDSWGLGEKQKFGQGVSRVRIHQDESPGKNQGLCVCVRVDLGAGGGWSEGRSRGKG